MKKQSIDHWLNHMTNGEDFSTYIYNCLSKEFPLFLSWVGERTCNLQCLHCIFQREKSFLGEQSGESLISTVSNMLQKGKKPIVIHEGRIVRPWHLPILSKIQDMGAKVGLIDNGTFVKSIHSFAAKLDWLDISIDGTKEVHDKQRNAPGSYQTARIGITQGRKIADKVTSLFTLTNINYANITSACEAVIDEVDEFHIIPISPVRDSIKSLEATKDQMKVSWKQIEKIQSKHPEKVFVRMYQQEDVAKLNALDSGAFNQTIRNPKGVSQGRVLYTFNGVTLSYFPKSLSINETIVLDIDSWYRLPYSIQYTIEELRLGFDVKGNNIAPYSIADLHSHTDIDQQYKKAVRIWWKTFGKQSLENEKRLFYRP